VRASAKLHKLLRGKYSKLVMGFEYNKCNGFIWLRNLLNTQNFSVPVARRGGGVGGNYRGLPLITVITAVP
jgi:hypothetical protein